MTPDKPYSGKNHVFLKAEAFIASLLSSGLSYDKLVTERAGSFAKSYRRDIEEVKVREDDHGRQVWHVKVNRDGIYDRLPEGLFHQPRAQGAATAGVGQMVSEYRRFRDEEKAARRFYQPLEHELFRYATAVEQEEQLLLWGLLSGELSNAFAAFWNLEEGLPEAPSSALVRLMPWAQLIKGDPALCAKALEMMIGAPVAITERVVQLHEKERELCSLGEGVLGVDTVTGHSFEEAALNWVFTIGPLPAEQVSSFLTDAPLGRFLQQFIDIFIPVEIDVVFEYQPDMETAETTEYILGYSFTL